MTLFRSIFARSRRRGEMSGGTAMDTMSSAPHMNEDNAIRYLTNFGKLWTFVRPHWRKFLSYRVQGSTYPHKLLIGTVHGLWPEDHIMSWRRQVLAALLQLVKELLFLELFFLC